VIEIVIHTGVDDGKPARKQLVDEHFTELRSHIARWFGSCDLNQTQVSSLRGNPIL
jgi:hypothetical protein